MTGHLIECVPNISEGCDEKIINAVAQAAAEVEGVTLLDIDSGKATNRSVITFVGEPEPVVEGAFRLIARAAELIDMSRHHGEHPRFGATDVCPFVPVANIDMEEVVDYARRLGNRVGKELEIPGYFYEHAATKKERQNLASCRAGEYEGLEAKLNDPIWIPDFGPADFNKARTAGALAIGARDFLVAYNINLNTTSTRRANAIAFDIRERGRVKREGGSLTGKIVNDKKGKPVYIPGSLKAVKGIGWYIEEYGIAQLSLNLTNISITPMHVAFDEACKKAEQRGIRVTGSELVGLVPLKAMLDAGRYFLKKQKRSVGVGEKELIKIAVKSLGLDDLKPFNPDKKIIEYMLPGSVTPGLTTMTLVDFVDEAASESPAPGGGSISAYVGALGVSLGTMVANLSAHKRGWDDRWEDFSDWAEKGMRYQKKLLNLVEEDTAAFNRIMDCFGMPKGSDAERKVRDNAIQEATRYATEVPLQVMQVALESLEVMKAMAKKGNPNSVTDAGVGALCARTAVRGAFLNVKINAAGLKNRSLSDEIIARGGEIEKKAAEEERTIITIVEGKI